MRYLMALVLPLWLSAATVDGLKIHSSVAAMDRRLSSWCPAIFLMLEKPEEFNRLLLAFLAGQQY